MAQRQQLWLGHHALCTFIDTCTATRDGPNKKRPVLHVNACACLKSTACDPMLLVRCLLPSTCASAQAAAENMQLLLPSTNVCARASPDLGQGPQIWPHDPAYTSSLAGVSSAACVKSVIPFMYGTLLDMALYYEIESMIVTKKCYHYFETHSTIKCCGQTSGAGLGLPVKRCLSSCTPFRTAGSDGVRRKQPQSFVACFNIASVICKGFRTGDGCAALECHPKIYTDGHAGNGCRL